MLSHKKWISNLLVIAVAIVFCGGPEFANAQQQPGTAQTPATQQQEAPPASQQQDEPAATQQQPATTQDTEQTQQQVRPGVVDPSAGPLRPVPSQPLPDAPSTTTTQQQQQQQRPKVQQPAGVGAAPAARTTGGAASKPAGNAIAPAKQNQRRALVLKLGLIGGAAIALGTVIALSKGTKSIPPGAAR